MRRRRQKLICCCCLHPRSSSILLLQTLLLLLSSIILIAFQRCAALSPDGLSLLAFKAAISDDPSSSLADWDEDDPDPCRWPGISCANISSLSSPRVVGIAVSGKNLSGYIPSELGTLLFLRRLNLHGNRLVGSIPAQLFNASSLHSLFLYDNLISGSFPAAACNLPRLQNLDLSKNFFSGPIPPGLRGCRQLQRLVLSRNRFSGKIPAGIWPELVDLVQLDLSSNQFKGSIPPDLGSLDSLTGTLNLSHNQFLGKIPESLGSLPATVSLDLRFNNLSGEIPSVGSLANQGPTSFLYNPGLCGFPLQIPCEEPAEVGPPPGSLRPGSPAARSSDDQSDPEKGKKEKMRTSLIVLIAVADAAGVALVGVILVFAYWKLKDREKCCAKLGGGRGSGGGGRWWRGWCMAESGGESASSDDDSDDGGGGEGELVTMDKGFKVELEELLRASAYVLGKGGNGIVYKVVVGDGVAVAVRRLGDGGASFAAGSGGGGGGGGGQERHWYKELTAEVAAMGRVRHPNVVRLRAYYWAQDEKLLISDFVSNGNLATALRAGRPGQPSCLSWSLRLRISQGAARGLAHIHDCSPRRFVHGAVKPSNILLDADFNSLVADFGLHRLLSLTSTASTSTSAYSGRHATSTYERPNPYRAPEIRLLSLVPRPTQKSDVYSFGVVLLEMLTGRSPEMSSPSPSSSSAAAAAAASAAAAAEQVPELVRWVRKGFDEARPISEMADPALLREAQAKKEVVAAFHVALACTEIDPEERPRMKTVSDILDRIGP